MVLECAMGQGLGRLARSRRVQLTPIPQADGKQLQRQSRSVWLVERQSYCTDKLLAG